jgi:predicted ester cyclase
VKRFVHGYQTEHDPVVIDEVIAEDAVDHSALPGMAPGRAGVRTLHEMLFAAFDGFNATIEDQLAGGDKVVTRKTFRGTHTGEFFGVPATCRGVEFGVIDIVRVHDGQIVEHWNQLDLLGLMRQLGSVPI